jgi:hypothetical protein
MLFLIGIFYICHLQLINTVHSIVSRDGICCIILITLMNRYHVQDKAEVKADMRENDIL